MRTGRRAAAILATLLAAAGPATATAASLYRYVDERGVVHFTDTPSDPRYKEVSPKKPMGAPIVRKPPRGLDGVIHQTARLHGLPPALVKALLYAEADATACTDPYDIDGDGKVDAVCEGPKNRNGFYGWGMTDALDAVTR